jgi:hypothetical protein
MTRYNCEFRNTAGEIKTVIVELDPIEISSVNTLRERSGAEESGVMAIAYAIQAGYRKMPSGFEYFAATAIPELSS